MKRFLTISVLFVVALPMLASGWNATSYTKLGAALSRRDATVNLLNGSYPIRLLASPSTPDWSRRTIEAVQLLLPEMERLAGRPLTWESVVIVAEKDLPSSQWTGYNVVHIRQGAALIALAHGLAHLWVAGQQLKAAWAQEAVAHWMAIDALRLAGYPDAARVAFGDAVRDFTTGFTQMDGPLPTLSVRDGVSDQYKYALAKATAFMTVLRAAMGKLAFGKFLQQIAAVKKPLGNDQFRELYDTVSGQSGEGLFLGWASAGSYQIYSATAFRDGDGDELVDVLEAAVGTHPKTPDSDNDGLSDGYEYWHDMNPMARSSGGRKDDLLTVGIAVDGLDTDWVSRSIPPIYVDTEGDGVGTDLDKLYAAVDGSNFCLMANFHGRLPNPKTTTIYVRIKTVGRVHSTTILGYRLDGSRNWIVRKRKGRPAEAVNTPRRPAEALKVFETCVDIADLAGVRKVKVNVSVWDDRNNVPLDDMGGWWAPVVLSDVKVR